MSCYMFLKNVEKVTNACQWVTEDMELLLDFKKHVRACTRMVKHEGCVCVCMLCVPGSAGLQPSLLTMTFPLSRRPCFSHHPPDSLFPSLNPSVLFSPPSLQPSILPPILSSIIPWSTRPPLSLTGWCLQSLIQSTERGFINTPSITAGRAS